MASSVEHRTAKRQAKRLLRYLQHPENVSDTKFKEVCNSAIDNREVFEQLRIQSDQFASIYPLFEGADYIQRRRLLYVLFHCAQSSVSANLLAKEKRIWGFVVALFEHNFCKVIGWFGNLRQRAGLAHHQTNSIRKHANLEICCPVQITKAPACRETE